MKIVTLLFCESPALNLFGHLGVRMCWNCVFLRLAVKSFKEPNLMVDYSHSKLVKYWHLTRLWPVRPTKPRHQYFYRSGWQFINHPTGWTCKLNHLKEVLWLKSCTQCQHQAKSIKSIQNVASTSQAVWRTLHMILSLIIKLRKGQLNISL